MNAASSPPLSIGQVVRDAVVFGGRASREALMNAESLPETVGRLFDLLEARNIEHVLVGGIALLRYIEGRNTEDIDLIVAVSALRDLPEVVLQHQDNDLARGTFDGLKLDFLLSRNKVFDLVRRRHTTKQPFLEREVRCATVEGLLLLKLYALPALYRLGNFARVGLYENDIATLMQAHRPAMEPLWKELQPHLSDSDLQAVRDVASDIERRIARFENH